MVYPMSECCKVDMIWGRACIYVEMASLVNVGRISLPFPVTRPEGQEMAASPIVE